MTDAPKATTIQPLEWKTAGHAYVGHCLGLVYYIDPLRGGAGYKTIHAGEMLYEGASLDAAKQAAQDHAQERVREVLV